MLLGRPIVLNPRLDTESERPDELCVQSQTMLIQVNTDTHIDGTETRAARVRGTLESALARFSDQITRLEVHLSDENSHKGGINDVRCVIEARLEGLPPTAVTHQAGDVDEAVDGAAGKLHRTLESTLGRMRDQQRGS